MASAKASAEKLTEKSITVAMREMNRPDLLEMLHLPFDTKMVCDIDGLHPVTLYQKSTLAIESWKVPFLNKGAAGKCCTGAFIARFGHKTVALKCFETELTSRSSVCAHCEELWAMSSDDNVYAVEQSMKHACARYAKGERRAMKNWAGMKDLNDTYSDNIQVIKDVLQGSSFELDSQWPGFSCAQAQKAILLDAGVLFEDAGRSRNPYARTKQDQDRIAVFTHKMIELYLRVYATVKPEDWAALIKDLQQKARAVQQAALWTMQAEFPADPVFVGPIVAADIVAAGLRFADARFRALAQASADGDNSFSCGAFSWGSAVDTFARWASSVQRCARPKLRSKLQSADDDTDASSSRSSKKSKWVYGVARGKKTGTFMKWSGPGGAEEQVSGYPGAVHKKFRSASLADEFVERLQQKSGEAKWWVLKDSKRDGAYTSKVVAMSYQGKGKLLPMWSIATAKEYLGRRWIPIYNETVQKESSRKYFALRGGTKDGVFESVTAMLSAKRVGGGVHDVFTSRAEAQKFCDDAAAGQAYYVVWEGSSTGVMTEDTMIEATRGVESVIEGPMSKRDADLVWNGEADKLRKEQKEDSPAASPSTPRKSTATSRKSAPAAAAPTLSTPSSHEVAHSEKIVVQSPANAEIEEAWMQGKHRAFSCWVSPTVGRVALSWEAAVEGVEDPEVKVVSSESNLFFNIAKAEKLLQSTRKLPKKKSVAQSMAEARAAVSANNAPRAGATSANSPAAGPGSAAAPVAAAASAVAASSTTSTSVPAKGQSVGVRSTLSGVVRTREAIQIAKFFVDADEAVKVEQAGEPSEMKVFGELAAPGQKIFCRSVAESGGASVTLKDYLTFKDSTAKAWPLKKFGEFMAFCDLGRSLCSQSSKPVAAANAAFFSELSAMAVRVYNNMARRNTLGTDEFRFSVRMYMSLQLATNDLILHVGSAALRFLSDSVDEFIALRIPDSAQSTAKTTTSTAKSKPRRVTSGCWLCPAEDHLAWDPKFHPRNSDGSRQPVSEENKKLILQRVQTKHTSAADKAKETADIKRYWSEFNL